MARSNSIIIGVSTDMRDAIRGFRDLGRATRNNLTTTQRWARGLRAASYVATSALIGMAIAAKKSIDDASDLAEAITKNEKTYKTFYQNTQRWAEEAAERHGLSTRVALDYATAYGDLFMQVGMGEGRALRTAEAFTKLTAGLGSFYNLPHEQVHTNLLSALAGEAEAVRKYGIDVSDLALRQEALALGIYSGAGALDMKQKRLAATSIIMKGATKEGTSLNEKFTDFTDTADGAANKTKSLTASIENLSASLGQELLPVYEWLLDKLVLSIQWIKENSALAKALAASFTVLAAGVLAANGAMMVYNARVAIAAAATKIFNIALNANPIVRVISVVLALTAVIGGLTAGFTNASKISKELGAWYDEKLKPIIQDMIPVIKDLGDTFTKLATAILLPLLNNVVVPAFEGLLAILKLIAAFTKGDFSGMWSAWKIFVKKQIDLVIGVFNSLWSAAKAILPKLVSVFDSIGSAIYEAIKSKLSGFADWLLGMVKAAIPRVLGAIRGSLTSGIKGILNAAVPGNPFMVPDIPTLEGDARNRSQPVTLNVTGQASVDRMMTEEAVAQALYRILRRSDARHGELWAA